MLSVSLSNSLEFAIMKGVLLLLVACCIYCKGAVVVRTNDVLNERPIIGVLSQEQSLYLHTKFPEENYTCYIAASYVKSVEAAGARVVPILIGKDRSYYDELMRKINGVLLPGGATYFNQSNGYADAGQMIYEIAMELNDAGNYFPIFGTCLGFELLIILASGRGEKENRNRCYSYQNDNLNFEADYRSSKMFRGASEKVIDVLKNQNVTVNAHQFCIMDENLKAYNLTEDWRVTSYSYDENGLEFIASIEHKKYPFYGVQFHPEKISFEWKLSKNYPHSYDSLVANRHFMDFFVKECRYNYNSFSNAAEENQYLIYNYSPKFTGALGSAYHQCYLFEPRGSVASVKK
ncbi:gamma-glutamyl hydrolase A-like isoform X2 [Danaus plexippus]|uniref:gamma-glutamyl hydrolase A-like isoform X2 n=1 Tax=Danaus plexippus TaxID=13037 RepID=UPI002AB1C40F|nr:gamma-glutamyl hydrolase A-like isoform X2 [Danaus plexippus]